jgi:tRNA(Ile)-lysidine synthase
MTLEVGRKKLQDIFVDLHIRKDKRYKVPLIVDNEGEILWIVPYKRNSLFKIDENTKKVLIFNAITQN